MDVSREFSLAQQFMDWILPVVAHYDHGLQEEEAWQTIGEVVWRRTSGWLACGHHLGSYFPHLLRNYPRHRIYVCQVIPSRRSDAAKPSHPHYRCVSRPHRMERSCLACSLPYLPPFWANARLVLRAVWCSYGIHCPRTGHDWHDWIFRVLRKLPILFQQHYLTVFISTNVVVPRALERISCCPWSHHDCGDSACHSQSTDFGVPLTRIQT